MTFSIITVTYNASRWIERTIDSVLSQTFNNYEHIIVDGASTDNTLEIVNNAIAAKANLQHYKIICEPDNGLYDAMNKGVHLAKGDYLWFLNAGDTFYSDNTLQNIYNEIIKQDFPSIIYGETEIVDSYGVSKGMRRLKAPECLDWHSFNMGMLVCHQSFVVRRDISPDYNLKYRYASDIDWCIRCMKQADKIHNSHLVLSRFLEAGLSDKNRKTALKERFNIMCRHYGTLNTLLRHIWFAIRFASTLF